MKTVVAYLAGVPSPHKSPQKVEMLKSYIEGVKRSGDQGVAHTTKNLVDCDVALLQGWISDKPDSQHLILRQKVIEAQKKSAKHTIAIDSNLFLYVDTTNPLQYLRYSFDGVFPTTGNYCDRDINPDRWLKIKSDLNLSLKDYRTSGDHILLCLQRNGGWSMKGLDVQTWAIQTIQELRKYTDRPIVIRAHPGDKNSKNYLDPKNPRCKIRFGKDIQLSQNINLVDDLKNCWAAVNYNSSPVVGAAIEGIPIFVSDIQNSQCREIANKDLCLIESPTLYERQPWVERLSMFHWSLHETKIGECWQHMRKFI